jgi:hypothetical protein
MAKQSTKLKSEIVNLKISDEKPHKIINEGDNLKLGITIHSFFWPYDGYDDKLDYEPLGHDKKFKYYLSRVHNHGLIIWTNYNEINGKGIVTFFKRYRTPIICNSNEVIFQSEIKSKKDRGHAILFKTYLKIVKHTTISKYKISSYNKNIRK